MIGYNDRRGKTLLWENSSPSSSFGAQTVTLSEAYTNYDLLIVLFRAFAADSSINTMTFLPVVGGSGFIFFGEGPSNNRVGRRSVTLGAAGSETSVEFSAGGYNGSTNNSDGVPLQIWGIRL